MRERWSRDGRREAALRIAASYVLLALQHFDDSVDGATVMRIVGASLTAPVTGGANNIIGLIIVGIALYEAWKLTRAITIAGPFRVVAAAPPPAGPPPVGPSP